MASLNKRQRAILAGLVGRATTPRSTKLQKPMLAAKPDPKDLEEIIDALPYPMLFSVKLDGVRCTVQNGRLYSRTLKLIPNLEMQAAWGRPEYEGLDGEIIAGETFSQTSSVVMSKNKPMGDAVFHVFDTLDDVEPFSIRHANASLSVDGACFEQSVKLLRHTLIENATQLRKYEAAELKRRAEGVMGRARHGGYKHGRSTLKECGLVAIKRFVDAEAVVLDMFEQMENTNEKTVNELGRSKRSSHKAGKVGKGTLGGFVVAGLRKDLKPTASQIQGILMAGLRNAEVFSIGTGVGLTDKVRQELWHRRQDLVGKILKFRYQKIGTKDAPRIPIFLGFRSKEDM
jgi:DNA ligase-1